MPEFKAFPSIEQFHNLVKAAEKWPDFYPDEVVYRAKVKLHGTNAAIGVHNGEAFAQSRNNIVTEGHFGFAEFVKQKADKFKKFPDCYIYGEWVGPGIQKKVACNQLPSKRYCIFAIYVDPYYYVEPESIRQFLSDNMGMSPLEVLNEHIHVIDWAPMDSDVVFYRDKAKCQEFVTRQEPFVQAVDVLDPWMKTEFDIEGIGEGLVYYPIADSDYAERERNAVKGERYTKPLTGIGDLGIHGCVFSKLTFKAKGQSHERAAKEGKRQAIQLSPEELKTQEEFVERFVTEDRLAQIMQEHCNNDFDMKNMGKFLKEFGRDVQKESQDELEANELEWNKIQKPVQKAARDWFIKSAKHISLCA